MCLLLALLLLFPATLASNFLVISPVLGYSHMKFMNKVADTLANGGHNVVRAEAEKRLNGHFQTILQIYNYEHFGTIRMAKNKRVEVL